jgi:hypothetical protein
MFVEKIGHVNKIDVIQGQATWEKMMSPRGKLNSTGMPPNQKSKQS